ncbi:TIGR04255 family protein [Salegentibacter flavus]|uniref:TIGR04255 family protein n=1 Tax=Salegentibacter flavus TaxID=287099 RepID=A0A1I4XI03_9FLAO|nr:TIGR04255 family protein [Salegentibacter flavus]SFN24889.1 TIGR04255 family protein [Salegentibacter flavus]
MKIPIKIEPDRIKDALMQVFYSSDLSYEILIGYVHKTLTNNGFRYVTPFQEQSKINGQQINFNPTHLFVGPNDQVKIQIHPNHSLTFNTISSYIGWTKYRELIENVLRILIDANNINSFSRVGIRYISEFENIDILDKVKFGYDQSFPGTEIDTSTSNLKWRDEGYSISLNLTSNLPVNITKEKQAPITSISLIDIDVIKQNFEIKDIGQLMKTIDDCHFKQKSVFFSLLNQDFLNELNPVY